MIIKIVPVIIYLLACLNILGKTKHDPILVNRLDKLKLDAMYYTEEAAKQIDSLKTHLPPEVYQQHKAYFWCIESELAYLQRDFNRALTLTDSALTYFVQNNIPEWEASCLLNLGGIAEQTHLIDEAQEAYRLVASISNEPSLSGIANMGWARCLKRNDKEWLKAYQQGDAQLRASPRPLLHLYADAIVFWFYPDSATLVLELKKIASSYEDQGLQKRAAGTYKRIAISYKKKNELDSALLYVNKALKLLDKKKNDNIIFFTSATSAKSQILQSKGFNKQAAFLLQSSLTLADSTGNNSSNYYTYLRLLKNNQEQGDQTAALHYSEAARKCNIIRSNKRVEIARIIAKQFYKRDILLVQLETLQKKQKQRIITISLILFFLLLVLVWYYTSRKKNLELTAIRLEQKNQSLEEINSGLFDRIETQTTNKKIKSHQELINEKISNQLHPESETSICIKQHYVENHLKAKMAFPTLRPKELECAVYIILEIPTKEIASIMHITEKTIHTYRLRIRQKLNLSTGNSLNFSKQLKDKLES